MTERVPAGRLGDLRVRDLNIPRVIGVLIGSGFGCIVAERQLVLLEEAFWNNVQLAIRLFRRIWHLLQKVLHLRRSMCILV